MTTLNQIKTRFRKSIAGNNEKTEFIAITGDREGVVKANEFGDIYVTHHNGCVQIVYNEIVPLIPRRLVVVGYRDKKIKRLEVLRYVDAYPNERTIDVPNHADKNHQWPNVDTLWVRPEQILVGLAIPDNGLTVKFVGFYYYLNNRFYLLKNKTIDFTSRVPVSGANYTLAQVDGSKTVSYITGENKDSREALVDADIPAPTAGHRPLFAVKLYCGQTRIIKELMDSDIVDLRWSGYAPTANGSGVFQRNLTANLIFDDGESLIAASYINTNGHDIVMPVGGDCELVIV